MFPKPHILCLLILLSASFSQAASTAPLEDDARQKLLQEFSELRFGMFLHYNMATYKGVQWVVGYHSPANFDPGVDKIDTDAWADAAVQAGMTYGVLTVKHVSGFCLWDSEYTTYDVMHPECPYQKDLVAQFIESFNSRGLKVGLYYCWRNPGFDDRKPGEYKVLPPECDPASHDLAQQNEFQKKQIAELLRKYPEAFYVWNDALDPRVMTSEQARQFFAETKPGVIASGNWWDWGKKGDAYLDIAVTEKRHFPEGNELPGETCWPLEQSWFWHEGMKPKPAAKVFQHLQTANARGSNFLLNVAPDRQGRLLPESVSQLEAIGQMRRQAVQKK